MTVNYEPEFNTWLKKWLDDNSFLDYYLDSEQKDILYNSNIWNSYYDKINYEYIIRDMIQNIYELELQTNDEYPIWVKEWRKKNNFSSYLIDDCTHDMLFKARFTKNNDEIERIRIMIQQLKNNSKDTDYE